LDLFTKRQRNVRAALERIIERAYEVDVNVYTQYGEEEKGHD
jgi:hypothetical protein